MLLLVLLSDCSFFLSVFVAYYSDICVGAIACRLEKKEGGVVRVYIMTLGVLAPYRGLGLGENFPYLNSFLLCEEITLLGVRSRYASQEREHLHLLT